MEVEIFHTVMNSKNQNFLIAIDNHLLTMSGNHLAELYSLDPSSRINVSLAVNDSSEGHAKQIFEALRDDVFLIRLKQLALEKSKSEKTIKTSREQVKQILDETGLKEVIVNTIVRLYERNVSLNMVHNSTDKKLVTSRRSQDEPYECIRKARIAWEVGINEELLTIADEMKRPLKLMRFVRAITFFE